jgi:hypothetical protein
MCGGERAIRAIEWQQDPPLRYRWRNSLGHTACSKSAWEEAASSPTSAPPCTPAALLPSSSPQLLQILVQVSLKIYFLSPAAMMVRCRNQIFRASHPLMVSRVLTTQNDVKTLIDGGTLSLLNSRT